MKVRFWGVRGSIPVPGPTTNRYGGNTSCVQIEPRRGDPIIIDAGTGLRRLGKELMRDRFGEGKGRAHLLISHTHWDHIQGLPFFAPLYENGNHLSLYARERDDTHLKAIFASQTEDPYFPVPLESLRAEMAFKELAEGQTFSIQSARVRCARLNHPWIALAYRVEVDGAAVVYASDTAPFRDILLETEFIATPPRLGDPLPRDEEEKLRAMREDLVDLCRGADLVIYDTQFTAEEYAQRPHWGHSTPDDAMAICLEAGARTLALFHHAPARSDDAQDAILAECRRKVSGTGLEVVAAAEGLEIPLGEQA